MKILIATNHSYMFYRFRKELVEALMQEHEVILSTPFVGHEDDLQAMGLRCIETDIDRRSINPFKDMKLLKTYRQMLDELQPAQYLYGHSLQGQGYPIRRQRAGTGHGV